MKFVKWFNNSSTLSWLFTPWRIKSFWRGYQRMRICERCYDMTQNIHWTKDDKEQDGKIIYGHKYLCEYCFLGIPRQCCGK
jgi:hypothetical protein